MAATAMTPPVEAAGVAGAAVEALAAPPATATVAVGGFLPVLA